MPDGAQLTRELDPEALSALSQADLPEPASDGAIRNLTNSSAGRPMDGSDSDKPCAY